MVNVSVRSPKIIDFLKFCLNSSNVKPDRARDERNSQPRGGKQSPAPHGGISVPLS